MKIDKGKKTLILIHNNSDPDALGSAFFLKNRFGGVIATPGKPDKLGSNLLDYLGIELLYSMHDDYEQLIILDTPDPKQLEPFSYEEEEALIIDHHKTKNWNNDVEYFDRTSCAEIIFGYVNPDTLSKKEAVALISGIITDTSDLRRGNSKTFRTLSRILELEGITLNEVREIISESLSYSEKIARLKGAERFSFCETNGIIIAKSKVGSFESSVSGALLGLGADIAFTGSQRNDEYLISGRAKDDIIERDFHIGAILKELSEIGKNISGGGHEGAGVMTGEGDVEKYLNRCVNISLKKIRDLGISNPKN
ncbi:MAG: DHH family phosphoesterase [Thermoplasmata archaeon]